ncbi:MAG: hypothetical protein KDK36_09095, partial [Leptospiraceae bacterium]|nr:hypothetical protein [Leptospiraceae bacterium]
MGKTVKTLRELKEQASITGYSPILYKDRRGATKLDWNSTLNDWEEEVNRNCSEDDFTDYSETGDKDGFQCAHEEIRENVPSFCQLKKCTHTEMHKRYDKKLKEIQNKKNPEDEYWEELEKGLKPKKVIKARKTIKNKCNCKECKPNKGSNTMRTKKKPTKRKGTKLRLSIKKEIIESWRKPKRNYFKRNWKRSGGFYFATDNPKNRKFLDSLGKSTNQKVTKRKTKIVRKKSSSTNNNILKRI